MGFLSSTRSTSWHELDPATNRQWRWPLRLRCVQRVATLGGGGYPEGGLFDTAALVLHVGVPREGEAYGGKKKKETCMKTSYWRMAVKTK